MKAEPRQVRPTRLLICNLQTLQSRWNHPEGSASPTPLPQASNFRLWDHSPSPASPLVQQCALGFCVLPAQPAVAASAQPAGLPRTHSACAKYPTAVTAQAWSTPLRRTSGLAPVHLLSSWGALGFLGKIFESWVSSACPCFRVQLHTAVSVNPWISVVHLMSCE